MDVLLPGGAADLEKWEARPFADGVALGPGPRDRRDRYVRVVGAEPPGPPADDGPFRRVADAIFAYRVFPTTVLVGELRRTPVQVGDTVGIRYRGFRAVDLFFAARVVDVFDEAHADGGRAGFTYRTLAGHPELGEETFAVDKHPDGRVEVSLTSWSRAGTLLAKATPFAVRAAQVHGSEQALVNLARIAGSGPRGERRKAG